MNKYIIACLLAIIFILSIIFIYTSISDKSDITYLRKSVIEKDSLLKVRDGEYTKLVNDTKKNSDLKNEVKDISESTFKDIKDNKEKITSVTGVVVQPKDLKKEDKAQITSNNELYLSSYYPSKDSAFVKYSASVKDSTVNSSWEFFPLKIDVIVTQQKDGIFRARFVGPKWIQVNNLSVNSLPMSKITERNLKFLVGASGGYRFEENDFVVGVSTGLRYKSNIFILNGTSNKIVSLGYLKEL